MSDQQDTASQLKALLAQMQVGVGAENAAPSAWSKPAAPASSPTEVLGVSVPISLDTPSGKVRVYLNFPGSCAASPEALIGLIQQLSAAGLPLDAWQPRDSGGGSGWGNGSGSGSGWNNSRGGSGWSRGGNSGWRR